MKTARLQRIIKALKAGKQINRIWVGDRLTGRLAYHLSNSRTFLTKDEVDALLSDGVIKEVPITDVVNSSGVGYKPYAYSGIECGSTVVGRARV